MTLGSGGKKLLEDVQVCSDAIFGSNKNRILSEQDDKLTVMVAKAIKKIPPHEYHFVLKAVSEELKDKIKEWQKQYAGVEDEEEKEMLSDMISDSKKIIPDIEKASTFLRHLGEQVPPDAI